MQIKILPIAVYKLPTNLPLLLLPQSIIFYALQQNM